MLLIFSGVMLRYFGRKAFAIALIIFVVFAFPRVMIGAHWFTDIAVGSLSSVLGCAAVVSDDTAERQDNSRVRSLPPRQNATNQKPIINLN